MLTLALVCIRCDTLALFVFQLAAGGGNADHAKWHVAEMQKNMLGLFYLEICVCSFTEKKLDNRGERDFPNEKSYRNPIFRF